MLYFKQLNKLNFIFTNVIIILLPPASSTHFYHLLYIFSTTEYLIVFFFGHSLHSMWDPNFQTRDGPQAPAVEACSLNQWTTREITKNLIFKILMLNKYFISIEKTFWKCSSPKHPLHPTQNQRKVKMEWRQWFSQIHL